MFEALVASLLTGAVRLFTGVQARWVGCGPSGTQRVYFANHSSHVDFVLLWAVLPVRLRRRTRPVAAIDYWELGAVRRYLANQVFRSVLVARAPVERTQNPIAPMCQAIDEGSSLIIFPEGTRGPGTMLQPFKAGLFHLAQARPEVDLVPAWIDNSYRVMPKGMALPVPLLCSVAFGEPLRLLPGEQKAEFLDRLRHSLIELGRT
jgi:1-acyl-sn-glycerol-3-phosphate acyltransferase